MPQILASDEQRIYRPEPTPYLFHQDNSFVRGILGNIGSGKSVACCMEIYKRCSEQQPNAKGRRRSRWAVIRGTYPELKTTTIRTWQEWFDAEMCPLKWVSPIEGHFWESHPSGDGTVIDAEIFFIALDQPKDIKKLLSLELTGAWINEAREVPKEIVDAVTSRLGRFPPKFDGGASWTGLIMDTNPPDDDHWWYKLAEQEKPQGWRFFRQPGALIRTPNGDYLPNPRAENVKNLALGYQYYFNQLPGKDPEWIKVYILGEYGSLFTGRPVYEGVWFDSIHVSDAPLGVYKGLPLYMGWDFGLCYSDDTEVLTADGWKFFKDVDEHQDRVATRNPNNGNLEYTSINFKVDRHYKGEMLKWSNSSIDFMVTPEHRVPFTFRDSPGVVHFAEAQWLADHSGGHHYVDLCANWPEESIKHSIWGMTTDVFAEFMGYYLSEGTTKRNQIYICQYKADNINVIQENLEKTGLPWKRTASGWTCNAPQLAYWLRSFGNQPERRVTSRIRNLGAGDIRRFIAAYTLGDGQNGSEEHTCFTTSLAMAGDLQELALKVGWNAAIRVVKPQTSVIVEDGIGRAITSNGGYSITFKKRAKRAELLRRNFERVSYDGRIYCLNVPYHTLYVRRNGRAHWNGNTPACVAAQVSPRGQLRILREYVCQDGGLRQFIEGVVRPGLLNDFPGVPMGRCIVDPAGMQRSQVDEMTCVQELLNHGFTAEAALTNDFVVRRNTVINFLTRRIGNEPGFIIDPSCRTFRKGMNGGYQFSRVQVPGEARYREVPEKNAVSHVCEAVQYLACGLDPQAVASRTMAPVPPARRRWGVGMG